MNFDLQSQISLKTSNFLILWILYGLLYRQNNNYKILLLIFN